ncbi:MAG: prepilin-type N-terminal cleavage/methylation domain-containing protein [Deltaproteobacteria bacterium]|nr:prepilin-type N-terminal cleavage/methylation domain-containing protein [Deltaproteobacteria bacterium]
MRGRPFGSRRGMTLLEVMVSLVVIVVMMVLALQAISNALEMRDLLEQSDATTRAARVALGKLRREVQLAWLTPHRDAVNTFQTVFVAVDDSPDRMYFASLAHQRLYRDTRESDQTEITVWAEPAPGRGAGYILYHREAPRVDEEPDEGGIVLPLAHDVRSFEVRFLDAQKDEWVDEWDTRSTDTPNRLPRAVQIGLVLIGPDPLDRDRTVDLPFLTTVVLEYAEAYPRGGLPLAVGAGGTEGGTAGRGARELPSRPSSRSGGRSRGAPTLPGRPR